MNPLLSFYLGEKNTDGVSLDEIFRWDDEKLEKVHNYIQWLFPTVQRSSFNLSAPVLDAESIKEWKANPELKLKLRRSAIFYMEFLERNKEYLCCLFDHNHLRVSRMLDSLCTLDDKEYAKFLFEKYLYTQEVVDSVDPCAFNIWLDKVK